MKYNKVILLLIVIIALVLRFIFLSDNPPSLTWDEAAWGYNGYTLGIDGRDEFGRFMPFDYLESFGDFKPPVYAYLTIIPIKLFGLNEFAVRFPSALFGTLTVLVTYFLVLELFNYYKNKADKMTVRTALTAAFFLAISPWHINLSRAAFEANISSFFIISGIFFFLYAIRRNILFLTFSVVFFVLSFYTFNTARIVTPLLVVVLCFFHIKELFRHKNIVIISMLIGIVLLAPLIPFLLSPQAKLRFKEVNIFSDISIIERTNEQISLNKNAWWSRIVNNRRFAYGVEYLKHYLDNFSPGFLFVTGDGNPKFSTQDLGQLYLWEIPFLITGLLLIIRYRENKWWLLPAWILIGVIPAATARETPHALRIETIIPTTQILTAFGLMHFISGIQNIIRIYRYKRLSFVIYKMLIITIAAVIALSLVYYLHGYYVFYPKEYSGEWQYGYKEAVKYINENYQIYDRFYFTEGLGRPYIYVLFFTEYSQYKFRETAVIEREALGFVHVKTFDKYYFAKDIAKLPNETGRKILFINVPSEVPQNAIILKTFNLLNGKPSLVAYTI